MKGRIVTIGKGYLPYLAPACVEISHGDDALVFERGLPDLPLTAACVDRRGGLVLEFGAGGERVALVGQVGKRPSGKVVVEITAEASGDVPEWWTADLMRRDLLLAVDLYLDEIQDGLSERLGDPKEGAETMLSVRAQVAP